MIIAHIPSGYILATIVLKRLQKAHVSSSLLIGMTVLGAVIPDVDLLYFYLIDGRQTHHHKYFTHWPIIWVSLAMLSSGWAYKARQSKAAFISMLVCLAAILHLMLDTVVGDIWWLAPFVDKPYAMFSVSARYEPWWLNFILHWSFLVVEMLICVWALLIYWRRSRCHLAGVH